MTTEVTESHWKCAECGLLNVKERFQCQACFANKSEQKEKGQPDEPHAAKSAVEEMMQKMEEMKVEPVHKEANIDSPEDQAGAKQRIKQEQA